MENPPVMSVLLPTLGPWPEVAASLESLLTQTNAPPFEILLLDGDGAGLAAPPADPRVRWFRFPGYDTFALRAAGVAAARGEIVAISEDHCVAPPDWVASTAHRADARLALVGLTRNHPDSSASAMGRANYLLTFAGQNPSVLGIDERRLPVPTNLSFKRTALPAELIADELEYQRLAQWRKAGELGIVRSVVLLHRQCVGVRALATHLASGRSYGATVRDWPRRERLRWWLTLPRLPLQLIRLALPGLRRHAAGARHSPADLPCLGALILANVCGQALGAASGAGTSRHHL
jgi:hypothetical protein